MKLSRAERDAIWHENDRCAWEAEAQKLDAQGYSRQPDNRYPAVFVKAESPSLVLVRNLGQLNWHPREV